uniref:Uncharacterized protein n=1 Tax=Meloidogyne incognita TaxID=6306 RepID=A0A914KKQ0_MELIC
MKQTSNFFIGELYEKCRNSAINGLNKEGKFNENKQTVTTIIELLEKRGFVYHCRDYSKEHDTKDCTFYNGDLDMFYYPGKDIDQFVDNVMEQENYQRMLEQFANENSEHEGGQSIQNQHEIENHGEHENEVELHADYDPNFPQQVVGSEDEHYNEPSSSTRDEHFGDLQNYPQLHSGQNTEWSNQLNQPGHPASSQGPWNQPFDSNEHYHPSHVHWPNPLGYDYYNQHNTSIQQNPSGQQIVWDWMNNASSSTYYGPYGGPHNPHLVQSVQDQNTALDYPLHHPWFPPFPHPHGLHQIQSDQSQNTMSGDNLNDPVNPPSFQNPFNQHNPRDWNRFY